MGIIYKIENDINGHLYIGQTKNSLQERWRKHLYRFEHEQQTTGIYGAFKKYGIEHFHPQIIEKCSDEMLDEREIYWISHYNTYQGEGYNLTPGGQNGSSEPKINLPQQEIISLYQTKNYSYKQLADLYGCSDKTISKRLNSWGVPKTLTKKQQETQKQNLEKGRHRKDSYKNFIPHVDSLKKKVARLNEQGEIEKEYTSLSDACRDLNQATNHTNRISSAIKKGTICFGYRWKYI